MIYCIVYQYVDQLLSPHILEEDMNYTDTVRTSSALRTWIYLVSATLWVHKHQQRLHELRGKRLHQERLPAAIQ